MTPSSTEGQDIQHNYYEEDTISLLDILLVLARNIKIIILIPTICCLVTIIYVQFFVKPVYVSTATFMSSGSEGSNSKMAGLASQIGISLPIDNTGLKWSYEEIIKSRTVAMSVLKYRFDTDEFGLQKELLQILTYGNNPKMVGIDTLIKYGISALPEMIKLRKTENSLYELKVAATEPRLATEIAEVVLNELDLYQREYNSQRTKETRKFIEERLLDTETELEYAEETLKEFRERNRNIFESPQLQLAQERLKRDVAVLISVFTTLKQQLETAKIEEVKESEYVVVLDTPNIPLYPSSPKKDLMVIIAGLIGIGFSIILSFIREFLQISNEEELEKISKAKSLILKGIIDFLPRRLTKTKLKIDKFR